MTFPEEQSRYLDPEGFGDYHGRDEWEISLEKQVPIRAEEAWNAWFARVWEGQSGQSAPVMIDPGEGPGRIGSVGRLSPGCGECVAQHHRHLGENRQGDERLPCCPYHGAGVLSGS